MRYKLEFSNTIIAKDTDFKFYLKNIEVEGCDGFSNIEGLVFRVKAGNKHVFVIKPRVCGAYL